VSASIPLGRSTATTGAPARAAASEVGRAAAQPAPPADPQQAVHDQVDVGEHRAGRETATGREQRLDAAAVRTVRVGEHRVDDRSAPRERRPRIECVPPVVPDSDEQRDSRAVDAAGLAQQPRDDRGEAHRRPPHQRARRQARHHVALCTPDVFDAISAAHPSTPPR
jgi:hypothetical protein